MFPLVLHFPAVHGAALFLISDRIGLIYLFGYPVHRLAFAIQKAAYPLPG